MKPEEVKAAIATALAAYAGESDHYKQVAHEVMTAHPAITADVRVLEQVNTLAIISSMRVRVGSPGWVAAVELHNVCDVLLDVAWEALEAADAAEKRDLGA
jgi:hypothetical protein